jgi:hypothetical protein
LESHDGGSDLGQAADRAGAIVSEQIRAMLQAAEARAREIRRNAEKDAREVRRSAAREAGALFRKLEELEAPLDALVTSLRGELDSLSSEFRRQWPADKAVVQVVPDVPQPEAQPEAEQQPEPAEPDAGAEADAEAEPEAGAEAEAEPVDAKHVEAEPGAQPEVADEPKSEVVEDAQVEPEAGKEAVEPETGKEAAEPQPSEAAAMHESSEELQATRESPAVRYHEPEPEGEAPAKKRGLFGWLKRRKSATFITTPGQCAVCYRSLAAGSAEALQQSGWRVSGELGLCTHCQQDGWQLPEGARLPYRRAAT